MGEMILTDRGGSGTPTGLRIALALAPLWIGALFLVMEHDAGHADRPDPTAPPAAVAAEPAFLRGTSRDDPVPILPETRSVTPAGRSRDPAAAEHAPLHPGRAPSAEVLPARPGGNGPTAQAATVLSAIPADSDSVYRWRRPAPGGAGAPTGWTDAGDAAVIQTAGEPGTMRGAGVVIHRKGGVERDEASDR